MSRPALALRPESCGNVTPEQWLWAAVLRTAVDDWHMRPAAGELATSPEVLRESARRWFERRGMNVGGFAYICAHLGISEDYVLGLLRTGQRLPEGVLR